MGIPLGGVTICCLFLPSAPGGRSGRGAEMRDWIPRFESEGIHSWGPLGLHEGLESCLPLRLLPLV